MATGSAPAVVADPGGELHHGLRAPVLEHREVVPGQAADDRAAAVGHGDAEGHQVDAGTEGLPGRRGRQAQPDQEARECPAVHSWLARPS